MAREDEIKLIAYQLWEEEGCPPGRDGEHWYRAEVIWQEKQPKKAAEGTGKQTNRQKSKVMAAKKKA